MLKKKTGALILAAVMAVCTMTTTAIAAQPPSEMLRGTGQGSITPYWVNASNVKATTTVSGSTVKATASVKAYSGTSDIDGTLYLEMKSGGSWTEVDSWSVSGTGDALGKGSYTGAQSGTYRSRVVVTVDGEDIEVVSASKTVR